MSGPSRGARFLRRGLLSLGVVVVLLVAGHVVQAWLAASKPKPERQPPVEERVAVYVRAVRRQAYRRWLEGYGRARALHRAQVAAETAGSVRWVAPELEAGAQVAPDTVLVRLEDRDARLALRSVQARLAANEAERRRLEADRDSARARLAVAKQDLALAESELARLDALQARGAASESERDRQRLETSARRTAVLDLEGRIENLEAQLAGNRARRLELQVQQEEAALDLERTRVHAPFAGVIEARSVEVGTRVAPGTVLFTVVDAARVEVPVALAASTYGTVRAGAPAELYLEGAPDPVWTGAVERVAPVIRSEDRTYFVYVVVETPEGDPPVPPGAFVRARVAGRRWKDVFVLPRAAFVGDALFVARGRIARRVWPRIVAELPDVRLADGGLEEGDAVIVSNVEAVADGARVAPAPASPAPEAESRKP